MSFEVITVGELEFPSPTERARWYASSVDLTANADLAKHFEGDDAAGTVVITEVLAEFIDVPNHDNSLVYYLDLKQQGATVTLRGLVHSEGFQRDFLSVLAHAADFGADGRVAFETTEGEIYVLTCGNRQATFEEGDEDDVDRELAIGILEESVRRTKAVKKPAKTKKPTKQAKNPPAKKQPANKTGKPAKQTKQAKQAKQAKQTKRR